MLISIWRGFAVMSSVLLLIMAPAMVGCANPDDVDNGPAGNDNQAFGNDIDGETPTGGSTGGVAQNQSGLLYVLQPGEVALEELAESGFTWLILEPSRTGNVEGEFTSQEVATIRTGGPCRKTILAYLSVGEAEDYRDYWDTDWVDGDGGPPIPGVAPEWLGPTNPDWPGNYKVRYWTEEWQSLILGTAEGPDKTPLDRIIDAGFDGVYLDIIDAYSFWSGPTGGQELTEPQARELMIEWVQTIAEYARQTRGAEGLLVFPQNASDIIRNYDYELDELSDAYFAAIDGIGIEDLFYDETRLQPAEDVDYRIEQLAEYRARGKTVLVTDYLLAESYTPADSGGRAAGFYERVLAAGFVPYAAVENRNLDEVVTLSLPDWSVDQPPSECAASVE